MGFDPAISALLAKIQALFSRLDIQSYIVGGLLRDLVLQRPPDDIDLVIDGDSIAIGPGLAENLGGRFVKLDETNRMTRIMLPVTEDIAAGLRHIDISSLHTDISSDLGRRDFSLNAMAFPLDRWPEADLPGSLIDPYRGLTAIREKKLVAVYPQAFRDDGLRLLRGIRLAAELGFGIDRPTIRLMEAASDHITAVAGERLRDEILKIFRLNATGDVVLQLEQLGVLYKIIPELEPCRGTLQPKEHRWNVFEHSVKCIDAVDFILGRGPWPYVDAGCKDRIPWPPQLDAYFKSKVSAESNRREVMKIAALLHDIAKPETRVLNDAGRIRFFGHPARGAPVVQAILGRLRFTSHEIKMVSELTRHHLRPVQISQKGQMPTDRALYRYLRDTGDVALDTLILSLADHLAARGPDLEPGFWDEHCRLAGCIIQMKARLENQYRQPRLINGHDLLDNFYLKPGPVIKSVLETVYEAQAVGDITTRKQAFELAGKILKSRDLPEVDRRSYRQGQGVIKS